MDTTCLYIYIYIVHPIWGGRLYFIGLTGSEKWIRCFLFFWGWVFSNVISMTSCAIPSYDMISFQVYIWWQLLQVRQQIMLLAPAYFSSRSRWSDRIVDFFSKLIHLGLFWQRCHGWKVERSGAFGFPNLTWEGFLVWCAPKRTLRWRQKTW